MDVAPTYMETIVEFEHKLDLNAYKKCVDLLEKQKFEESLTEFMKYVNSVEGMELVCMGQRKHSALSKVSDEFYAEHPNPYIQLFADLGWSENAFTPPATSLWKEYEAEMTAAFDDIWLMRATPEEALGRVQDRMQAKLDSETERWERRGKDFTE